MKKIIKNLVIPGIIALLISSCGKKAANILVPEDAAMVMHIDAGSMSSKLSWDEMKKSDWFKMASKEGPTGDLQRRLLDDPENSGIDLKSDMYFFIQPKGSNTYMVAEGKLKDAKAFETMLTKIAGDRKIQKDGDLNYTGDNEACMSWNSDRFITVTHSEDFQNMENRFGPRPNSPITMDSLLTYAKELYKLKKNKSIGHDSRFSSLMNEKGDIHVWLNAGSLISRSMPKDMGGLLRTGSLLEGNVTGYTMSFDNGKITASSRSWFGKELTALMKKYRPGNIDADMLKRIPGQNVSLVIAMNYPPEGLKEFLKLLGVDGILNGLIGMFGVSIDDFIKANKGDLLFAASDFSVQDKTNSDDVRDNSLAESNPEPDAKVLFATSINDKSSFNKIVDVIKDQISKPGMSEDVNKIKYTIKDNWFIAGNDQTDVDGFAAGNPTEHAFISKISGHPVGAYMDLKKLLGGIKTKQADGFNNMLTGEGNIWDHIIFYGGEMKDGAVVGNFEVNMIDKNTNSLKQLNNFLSSMAKTVLTTREGVMIDEEFPEMDTMTVRPVPEPKPVK